jgi:hypothetical protein
MRVIADGEGGGSLIGSGSRPTLSANSAIMVGQVLK